MKRELYRYNFESSIASDEIEATLLLAIMAAESLHAPAAQLAQPQAG